jgi:tRNA-splicing ligase RtcB
MAYKIISDATEARDRGIVCEKPFLIKAWTDGVQVEDGAITQMRNTASMPFVYKWLAAMPDVHQGAGATIGTVLATKGAIIPAAVGVDIGCGMMAVRLNMQLKDLDVLPATIRTAIEKAVPAGRTHDGNRKYDRGAWGNVPGWIQKIWHAEFKDRFEQICADNPGIKPQNDVNHFGTLGTGNHFIELSKDEHDGLWVVLHSGSRGPGNRFGVHFIKLAKELCKKWFIELPDPDLAYLPQGTAEFDRYWRALHWAQKFAWKNRLLMMENILSALGKLIPGLEEIESETVHCHHNYATYERHFGQEVIVTRKGAVRAQVDDMGIIPGSMGARSYIVKGKGNRESFNSCSHGAGRAMGRKEALKRFTVEDHIKATEGIECAKDDTVLDETPGAYKPIEAVMTAQSDLVEIVHELKQIVCVKGGQDVQ